MNTNRREYFRVDNEIYLTVERIAADQLETEGLRLLQGSERERLLNRINLGRASWRPMLRQIAQRNAEVGDYLDHLEEQLELITRYLNDQQNMPDDLEKSDVNLSAAGIRFHTAECFDAGESLKLTLVLSSCPRCIHAIGEVVRCEQIRSRGLNAVSVQYTHLQDPDRESLIQHVMGVERESIRQDRE